nr:type I inositol polyphosphate 5-phosphatase 4-like [Tanacetum cinerariifolium]
MWLFRHKYHADGTLSCYKARLVANGSIQLEGVDVDETLVRLLNRVLFALFSVWLLLDIGRIFVATWNVAGRSLVESLAFDLDEWLNVKESADIYVLGYLDIITRYIISSVKVSAVACGIMGYLGNKGSVSVSMSIEGTSFCFIVAHLASGEKKGDQGRRNHQVSEIFKRTTFTRHSQDSCIPQPLTILGHELLLENDLARELIKKHDWTALQEFDQLRQELEDGGVFQRAGEKQRTPTWILWYGKEVKQHSYFRSESKFSDHRPVSALFSTQIEVIKSNDAKVVPLQQDVPNTVSSVHM